MSWHLRSALAWDFMRRGMVVFFTDVSGPICCPGASVRNYHLAFSKIVEEEGRSRLKLRISIC
jgi:hypothetical protein